MTTNRETAEQSVEAYVAARADGIAFLTYGTLATLIGRPGEHRLLGAPLDMVRGICKERGIPDIAAAVVDKVSMENGRVASSQKAIVKYGGWPNLCSEQAKVIACNWS